MAKGTWFVKKKDKFYGPFNAAKVKAYKAAGKIKDDTPVAMNKQGIDWEPFGQWGDRLVDPPATPEQEPIEIPFTSEQDPPTEPEADTPSAAFALEAMAGVHDEPKEWYVCTPEKRYGPYTYSHLKELHAEGKLDEDSRIQKEGSSQLIEFSELLAGEPVPKPEPEPAPEPEPKAKLVPSHKPKPKKQAPKIVQKPGPRRPKKPTSVETKPKKHWGWMIAGLLIVVATVLGLVIKTGSDDPEEPQTNLFGKIKQRYDEAPTIRNKLKEFDLPPFNKLIQDALATGLNFSQAEVLRFRQNDQPIASQRGITDGPDRFGDLFPQKIRHELQYAVDGNYHYTYLVGLDKTVFAVVIEYDPFKKYKVSNYKPSDFAAGTTQQRSPEQVVWTKTFESMPGIVARAVWTADEKKQDFRLNYLYVLDEGVKE